MKTDDAYLAVKAKADAILADLDTFEAVTKDPYWSKSARQHIVNGLAAYKPPEPQVEDLF